MTRHMERQKLLNRLAEIEMELKVMREKTEEYQYGINRITNLEMERFQEIQEINTILDADEDSDK